MVSNLAVAIISTSSACLGKIGATDGKSFVQLAASMTGMTPESYTAMMVGGRRALGAPLTVPQPTNPAEGGL